MATLILIVLVLVIGLLLIAHKGKPRLNKKYFQTRWQELQGLEDYRQAISQADALLNEAMQYAGIKGGSTQERLARANGFLKDLKGAHAAHQIYQQIIANQETSPTAMDCQKALRRYKKSLQDLGAL